MNYLNLANRGATNLGMRLRYNALINRFNSLEKNIEQSPCLLEAFEKHEEEWRYLGIELSKLLNEFAFKYSADEALNGFVVKEEE